MKIKVTKLVPSADSITYSGLSDDPSEPKEVTLLASIYHRETYGSESTQTDRGS